MIARLALTGALLLSLAACGRAGPAGDNSVAGNAAAANAALPAPLPPVANTAAAQDDHGHQDGPRLLLTGTGLLADGTDASEIRFGAPRAGVVAAVTRTLGPATATNAIEDCGGSGPAQATDWGTVVLFFQNDRLVGWEQRQAAQQPWVGTPGGAAVGSRRPDLDPALGGGVRFEQSTLGTEFSGGGISGLLANNRPDAQVDRLWAGSNCAMR